MDEFENVIESDDFLEDSTQPQENVVEEDNGIESIFNDDYEDSPSSQSIIDKFLQSKGIVDSKIKVIDEDSKEVEVKFSDLSEEEQLDILNSLTTQDSPQVDDSELAFLNELKKNNLTIQQFLDLYKESVISEAGLQPEPSYTVDQYDDKELFLLDLKNKYDLTDEELQIELEKELQNEELFNKKVAKLRSEYKELEEQYNASQKAEFEKQQQQQYNQFVDQMTDIAVKTTGFHGLELEDEDKNNTLSYLLDLDENGMSQFYKDLNNPEKIYEVAWYLKYGKDAFKAVEDVYEAEIAKLKSKVDKPRVVRHQNNENDVFNNLF